jgi:hypothetical protein
LTKVVAAITVVKAPAKLICGIIDGRKADAFIEVAADVHASYFTEQHKDSPCCHGSLRGAKQH